MKPNSTSASGQRGSIATVCSSVLTPRTVVRRAACKADPVTEMAIDRGDIEDAAERIGSHVRVTPTLVVDARDFGLEIDATITLKLECLQHAGSFKTRGAYNRVLSNEVPACRRDHRFGWQPRRRRVARRIEARPPGGGVRHRDDTRGEDRPDQGQRRRGRDRGPVLRRRAIRDARTRRRDRCALRPSVQPARDAGRARHRRARARASGAGARLGARRGRRWWAHRRRQSVGTRAGRG